MKIQLAEDTCAADAILRFFGRLAITSCLGGINTQTLRNRSDSRSCSRSREKSLS